MTTRKFTRCVRALLSALGMSTAKETVTLGPAGLTPLIPLAKNNGALSSYIPETSFRNELEPPKSCGLISNNLEPGSSWGISNDLTHT